MNKSIQLMARGAIMIALATVLSVFAVFKLPNGGSVTIGSMVPIIVFSLMASTKWGVLASVAYGVLQMMMGFYAPPTEDFLSFTLVILLDYIVAFGGLGLAGAICHRFHNKRAGILASSVIVVVIRFICHFLSGILIWDVYAPEGQPVWLYSLLYNGSYMGAELVITVAIMAFLSVFLLREDMQKKLSYTI